MSGHDQKFICNINEHAPVADALKELTAFQDKHHEEKKFIEQRLKALKKEKQGKWRALWDAAKGEGLIDPLLNYDEYNMSLGDGRKQLFIEHCDCPKSGLGGIGGIEIVGSGGAGLKDLLSKLLGKELDD